MKKNILVYVLPNGCAFKQFLGLLTFVILGSVVFTACGSEKIIVNSRKEVAENQEVSSSRLNVPKLCPIDVNPSWVSSSMGPDGTTYLSGPSCLDNVSLPLCKAETGFSRVVTSFSDEDEHNWIVYRKDGFSVHARADSFTSEVFRDDNLCVKKGCTGAVVPRVCEADIEGRNIESSTDRCKENACVPYCQDSDFSESWALSFDDNKKVRRLHLRKDYGENDPLPDDHISQEFLAENSCVTTARVSSDISWFAESQDQIEDNPPQCPEGWAGAKDVCLEDSYYDTGLQTGSKCSKSGNACISPCGPDLFDELDLEEMRAQGAQPDLMLPEWSSFRFGLVFIDHPHDGPTIAHQLCVIDLSN